MRSRIAKSREGFQPLMHDRKNRVGEQRPVAPADEIVRVVSGVAVGINQDPGAKTLKREGGKLCIRPELIQQRRIRALDLRKAGYTYRQIGEELAVSHKTAYTDVQKSMDVLASIEVEKADSLRRMELQRLDALWRGSYVGAVGGDPAAIRAALGIIERRSKLLGLDAPAKTEHSGNVSFVELASMLDMPVPLAHEQPTLIEEDDDE